MSDSGTSAQTTTENQAAASALIADTNGDGTVDTIYLDTDGNGTFETALIDTDGDTAFETLAVDADDDDKFEVVSVAGRVAIDTDGDGYADTWQDELTTTAADEDPTDVDPGSCDEATDCADA